MGNEQTPDPERIDTGEPIAELAALRVQPDDSFFNRIHNSIHRRTLTAQALDFSLMAVFATVMDYLIATLQVLGGKTENERK